MKYEAIVWGFDGTLADSLASLLAIYNNLAAKYRYRPIDDPEAIRGLTALALIRRQKVPLFRVPALMKEILTAHGATIGGVPLFLGVAEVLRNIPGRGVRMSVLSSNSSENIQLCLRANQVEGLFDSVVGYRRLFGKANGLRRLLTARTLDRSKVIYVGDEIRDIETARKAGVAVAAVTWGFNARAVLADHGPDYLIDRADQLLELLG